MCSVCEQCVHPLLGGFLVVFSQFLVCPALEYANKFISNHWFAQLVRAIPGNEMTKMASSPTAKSILQLGVLLTLSVGLGACAASAGDGGATSNTAAGGNTASITQVPKLQPPGGGKDYEWGKDHIFIKLSSADTNGLLTLVQDNLKPGFDLGLHLHRTHTEIFYILDGQVDFTIGKKPVTATKGSVIYLPGGTPHAARSSTGGKMLMFYAPGGFDEMLAEVDNASWLQRINPFASARRNKKYDIYKIKSDDAALPATLSPRFLKPGEGTSNNAGGNDVVVKLTPAESGDLAELAEVTLTPGGSLAAPSQPDLAQIMYVLDGTVNTTVAGKARSAATGATIYFPPGTASPVTSQAGATLLILQAKQ